MIQSVCCWRIGFDYFIRFNVTLHPCLAMCRHVHRRLGRNSILAPPQTGHSLLLRVELQTGLAVECVGTAARNRLLVTSEGEHGEL